MAATTLSPCRHSAAERICNRHTDTGFSDWGDNPISEGMYEAAALAAGASLVAAEAVWNGEADAVFNAGGGYHHAGPDFASGFCVFNDAVIAILRLLALGAERIATWTSTPITAMACRTLSTAATAC